MYRTLFLAGCVSLAGAWSAQGALVNGGFDADTVLEGVSTCNKFPCHRLELHGLLRRLRHWALQPGRGWVCRRQRTV